MQRTPLLYFELRSRAKYQVETRIVFETGIESDGFRLPACSMSPDGKLAAEAGFVWDGPSGPTLDGQWNLQPSLWHDMLCKGLRHTDFGAPETHRERQKLGDQVYRAACFEGIEILREFGLAAARTFWQRLSVRTAYRWHRAKARIHYRALRIFGAGAGEIEGEREIRVAV